MWKLTRGRHAALHLNTLTHRRIPRTVWDGLRTPSRLRTLDLELRHPVCESCGAAMVDNRSQFLNQYRGTTG